MSDAKDFIIRKGVLMGYEGDEPVVIIPEGVTRINHMALSNTAMTSVVIPNSVTSIGEQAFAHCYNLNSVIIPDSVSSIDDWAFFMCTELKSVELSNKLTSIGDRVFYDCGLRRITIPDGVTRIESEAFCGCRNLSDITIPDSITFVGERAFEDTEWFEKKKSKNAMVMVGHALYYMNDSEEDVIVPDGVTCITDGAFSDNSKLSSVRIPESVDYIGLQAFSGCCNLNLVTVPAKAVKPYLYNCKTSFVYIETDGQKNKYYAYSDKSGSSNIVKYVSKAKWKFYDQEIINNGTMYKYKLSVRLAGAIGRLMDPVALTDTNKALFIELINKNANKIVGFAEELNLPEIIRDLLDLKILENNRLAALKKKMAASQTPSIVSLASIEVEPSNNVVKEEVKHTRSEKLNRLQKVELLEETVMHGSLQEVTDVYKAYEPFEITARALALAARYRGLDYVKVLIKMGATFNYEYSSSLQAKYHVNRVTATASYKTLFYLMLVPDDLSILKKNRISDYIEGIIGMNIPEDMVPIDRSQRMEIIRYLFRLRRISMDEMMLFALQYGDIECADALLEITNDYKKIYWEGCFVDILHLSKERDKFIPAVERLVKLSSNNGEKLIITNADFEKTDWDEQSLQFVLSNDGIDMSKVNKKKAMKNAVETNSIGELKIMCENGWLKNAQTRDELIGFANANQYGDSLAYLMEYKNATVDIKAEETKKSAAMEKRLNENPNSVAALKRIWSYQKRIDDDTLVITSYKGNETEVVIPAYIGKDKVTAINYSAFNPKGPYCKNGEVRRNITSVTIPDGIDYIGSYSFCGCESLKSIIIPKTVQKICNGAFAGCKDLTDFYVSKQTSNIDEDLFIGIGVFNFGDLNDNLTIHTPEGSPAEVVIKRKYRYRNLKIANDYDE